MEINYESEARRIINLIKKDFRLPDGSLCLERVGDDIFQHHIFPDLGDFLPFFIYFGEHKFSDEQISLYKSKLQKGLLVSEFPAFGISGLVKSYEYSDLLFGLMDYHNLKNTKESRELLLETANRAIDTFNLDKKVSSFYYPKLKIHLPIFDTRDGTLLEFYVDLYVLTREKTGEKYLDIARNIYKNLISSGFYKEKGLFPTFDTYSVFKFLFKFIGINKFSDIKVFKNNTNSLFGLLSLYSVTKEEDILKSINEVISSIEDKALTPEGAVMMVVYDEPKSTGASLTASFAFIDFLCDLHKETKEEGYMVSAEKCAEYWLSTQGKTGLFPFENNVKESFLDSETDMSVALLKLYEITKKEKYKIASDKCLGGILKYHGERNYVLGVHVDTGEVLNKTQRTKFLALFMKLLILRIELDKGKSIYDKNLWSLLKDR